MSQTEWVIIGTGFMVMMGLALYLKTIDERLARLVEITERIRRGDSERDF